MKCTTGFTIDNSLPFKIDELGSQRVVTVWKKKIFRYLQDYNSANMADIHKIPFDYCLDINS